MQCSLLHRSWDQILWRRPSERWFRGMISKSFTSINFKPSICANWVSVQKWYDFWHHGQLRWAISGSNLRFLDITEKVSFNSFQTLLVGLLDECSEMIRFLPPWQNFSQSTVLKMSQFWGFLALTEKVFIHFISNLAGVHIGWVWATCWVYIYIYIYIWETIMIPMCRLWLYELHGPRCPLCEKGR